MKAFLFLLCIFAVLGGATAFAAPSLNCFTLDDGENYSLEAQVTSESALASVVFQVHHEFEDYSKPERIAQVASLNADTSAPTVAGQHAFDLNPRASGRNDWKTLYLPVGFSERRSGYFPASIYGFGADPADESENVLGLECTYSDSP